MLRLLLVLLLVAPAWTQSVDALMQQAEARAEAKDYGGALKLFEQALQLEPANPACLFNAGRAAYMAGEYPAAVSYWQRFRKADPGEIRGRTKLIQAYQAGGHNAEAEAEITQLVQLWNTGGVHDPTMVEERSFVRDQFTVGKLKVMAFQFFVPDPGRREHTWDFVVMNESGERQSMMYFMYDPMASQQGQYYFDMRNASGRRNLCVTSRKPTYEEAAALVKRVLRGEKLQRYVELPGAPFKK